MSAQRGPEPGDVPVPKARAATPEDAPALARVLGDWVREAGWMPVLHTREEDEAFLRHLIATSEVTALDDASGFLARSAQEVLALYLAPAVRGRGLGRALLDRAKARSPRLALWTFQANAGARAFYAREGFREVRQTPGDNEEGLPDVLLAWEAPRDALRNPPGKAPGDAPREAP